MQEQNKSFVWEFIMYHLVVIDLIVRMDWLSKYHAILDCYKKKVYIPRDLTSGQKHFFLGQRIENQQLFNLICKVN